jgi:hypothetical protein
MCLDGFLGSLPKARVIGEIEVIVGTEHNHLSAVNNGVRTTRTLKHSQFPIEAASN